MKLQLKRSNVLESGAAKQPTAEQLEYGELAINYNADDPTMFIKDSSNGIRVFPIRDEYPVLVGPTAPNPTDHEEGTLWWNSDVDSAQLFVLYSDPADGGGTDPGGLKWIEASPTVRPDEVGSQVIISDSAPAVAELDEGTMWWNSNSTDLQLYVLYNNNGSKEWVEASPNTGGGGAGDSASVSIAPTAPITADSSEGDLWFNSDDGRLYIYYVDSDSSQWIDASPDSYAPETFVEKAGDTMTGSLALNDKITLNSTDGSATFAGEVGIGATSVPTNFRVEIAELGNVGLNLRNTNNSAGDNGRIAFSQGSGNLTSSNTFVDIIAKAETVSPLTGSIKFRTNQGNNLVEAVQIDSSGNATFAGDVSIGNDSTLTINNPDGTRTLKLSNGSNFAEIESDIDPIRLNAEHVNGYIRFDTNNGNERMRINALGDVGIGTTVPTNFGGSFRTLEVSGGSGNDGGIFSTVTADNVVKAYFYTESTSNTAVIGTVTNHPLVFRTNTVERMRIDNTGYIQSVSTEHGLDIGTTQGAGTTYVLIQGVRSRTGIGTGGSAVFRVYSNGDVGNTNNSYSGLSDITLKENIVPASDQWNNIKDIEVVNYNFKEETGNETHKQLGVIAQQVEEVSPGLVNTDEEGLKSVNYSVLYMKSVKALQEAMARIELLESSISKRDQLISDLTKRVETLEV